MLLLQGRIAPPPKKMTLCVIGRVKFERNCGKIYSRHLFSVRRIDQHSEWAHYWVV